MITHTKFSPADANESRAKDTRTLLAATAHVADHSVEDRDRLTAALSDRQQTWSHVQQRGANGAKATDRTIRTHPYEATTIALGVRALAGLMIHRLR